jgi:hypothetical protein
MPLPGGNALGGGREGTLRPAVARLAAGGSLLGGEAQDDGQKRGQNFPVGGQNSRKSWASTRSTPSDGEAYFELAMQLRPWHEPGDSRDEPCWRAFRPKGEVPVFGRYRARAASRRTSPAGLSSRSPT